MLLNSILNNSKDYIHISSLMRSEYKILYNTEDSFLIYFPESNIYIAESISDSLCELVATIKCYHPDLLETTNLSLFEILRNDYLNSYECYQYGPFNEKHYDEKLIPLKENDLPYVLSTYHNEKYLRQLFDRKRILGYYDNNELIGYIANHIDKTLGALYVSPQYRNQGYGKKIIKAATLIFDDPLIYSQVMDDNIASIRMHDALNIYKSNRKICWLHNTGFLF